MILLLTYIFVIGITIALWNGYIILWGLTKNNSSLRAQRDRYSKIWHTLGLVLRFEVLVIIAITLNTTPAVSDTTSTYVNVALFFITVMWILYDLTINIVRYAEERKPYLLYVDNKGINSILLKVFKTEIAVWMVRFIFIIGNVLSLILWTA